MKPRRENRATAQGQGLRWTSVAAGCVTGPSRRGDRIDLAEILPNDEIIPIEFVSVAYSSLSQCESDSRFCLSKTGNPHFETAKIFKSPI